MVLSLVLIGLRGYHRHWFGFYLEIQQQWWRVALQRAHFFSPSTICFFRLFFLLHVVSRKTWQNLLDLFLQTIWLDAIPIILIYFDTKNVFSICSRIAWVPTYSAISGGKKCWFQKKFRFQDIRSNNIESENLYKPLDSYFCLWDRLFICVFSFCWQWWPEINSSWRSLGKN